jgi:hypothetical protein
MDSIKRDFSYECPDFPSFHIANGRPMKSANMKSANKKKSFRDIGCPRFFVFRIEHQVPLGVKGGPPKDEIQSMLPVFDGYGIRIP